jgi:hypothetical protein
VNNALMQGEAIDSALEGEDDETKIESEVAMVIAELGLVMVGQSSVRKTGSIRIRFPLNPLHSLSSQPSAFQDGKPVPVAAAAASSSEADLEKRLADLRKSDL